MKWLILLSFMVLLFSRIHAIESAEEEDHDHDHHHGHSHDHGDHHGHSHSHDEDVNKQEKPVPPKDHGELLNQPLHPEISMDLLKKLDFVETFQNGPKVLENGRWVTSKNDRYSGHEWVIDAVFVADPEKKIYPAFKDEKSLAVHMKHKHYGLTHVLEKPFDNTKNTLVFQYEVRLHEGIGCSGAYAKLLLKQDNFDPVKWEETSEEEASPKANTIAARKSLLGLRKLSISPAGISFSAPSGEQLLIPELDIGTCVLLEGGKEGNNAEHSGTFLTSIENSLELEKLGMRFSGVYTGRGGAVCAKYVAEHLQRCIVEALGQSPQTTNDYDTVFAEAFKSCDDGFNAKYYKDSSGTSALAVLIHHRTIHVAWVGDIRAVLRSGNDVRALTIDHHPSEPTEKKRILQSGGLIVGGQIMGILSTSRGFGDNDLKAHLSDGVFIANPSVVSFTIDDTTASTKLCFLILASHSVFSVMTNETCCKIVARALSRHDNNPNIAAKILARTAERKSQQETAVTVIVWNDFILQQQRSRSSSATSWRSLRSFSAFETIDEQAQ